MTFLDVNAGFIDDAAYKEPCACATTGDWTGMMAGLPTIDGYVLMQGDRVLVWQNLLAYTNGIWRAQGGAWTRATDFSSSSAILNGTQVLVANGTLYKEIVFVCQTNRPVIGTTNIVFTPQSSAAFANLPTSDPHVAGALWNNGNTVSISTGP